MIELVERKLAERYNIHGAHKFAAELLDELLDAIRSNLLQPF